MEWSISRSYLLLSRINELLLLANINHVWVCNTVKRTEVTLLVFNQCAPQLLTTNSFIHCTYAQSSYAPLCMATTVVKQKCIVVLILKQNSETIDAVFDLENHVIPSPVPSVSTEFKFKNKWRLCMCHLLGISIYFSCGCFIKIILSVSKPIDLL
jgi:hypothetical protein